MRTFLTTMYMAIMTLATLSAAGYLLGQGDHSVSTNVVVGALLVLAVLLTRLAMLASTLDDNA